MQILHINDHESDINCFFIFIFLNHLKKGLRKEFKIKVESILDLRGVSTLISPERINRATLEQTIYEKVSQGFFGIVVA